MQLHYLNVKVPKRPALLQPPNSTGISKFCNNMLMIITPSFTTPNGQHSKIQYTSEYTALYCDKFEYGNIEHLYGHYGANI